MDKERRRMNNKKARKKIKSTPYTNAKEKERGEQSKEKFQYQILEKQKKNLSINIAKDSEQPKHTILYVATEAMQ